MLIITPFLICSAPMSPKKPLVFVSCGQYSEKERRLGEDIRNLVASMRPDVEPYYAQAESTVDGLSQNILRRLHEAAGLICVMHQRGRVFHDAAHVGTRASVWIEQEIAIAAFMKQVLRRETSVVLYVQKGVCLEGLRSVLHLNPCEFTVEQDVQKTYRSVYVRSASTGMRNTSLNRNSDTRRRNRARGDAITGFSLESRTPDLRL